MIFCDVRGEEFCHQDTTAPSFHKEDFHFLFLDTKLNMKAQR